MNKFMTRVLCALVSTTACASVKDIEVTQVTVPVMINRDYNKIIGLNVVSEGKPETISAFAISFKGSNGDDIKSVSIYESVMDEKSGEPKLEGVPGKEIATASGSKINKKTNALVLESDYTLKDGDNHLWVGVTVNESASLSRNVTMEVKALKSDRRTHKLEDVICTQRIGYAITIPNQEVSIVKPETGKVLKKRNSKYFRIPGLARSKKGTLIAAFDNRYNHNGDLPADIDVAVRRSTDGGQTWSPITTAIAAQDVPGIGHGCGDPAILVDKKNGRIWVAGLAAPKTGHPIWKSVKGSTSPDDCGQFILAYSDDDGKTWSNPINITKDIKRLDDADTEEWGLVFQGPGNGICMSDGTLVFPAQIWGHLGKENHWGCLVYSKDQGKTWTSSKAMEFGGSETQVAELSNGSLMLNCREGAGGWRQVGTTKDMGETWKRHSSVDDESGRLRNPHCQGCLISATGVMGKKHVLLFSNPNSGRRDNMTVKYSTNNGRKWSDGLLYDQRWGMGYSAIIPLNKNYLGVFYEGEHHYLYFLRIPFKEIFE